LFAVVYIQYTSSENIRDPAVFWVKKVLPFQVRVALWLIQVAKKYKCPPYNMRIGESS